MSTLTRMRELDKPEARTEEDRQEDARLDDVDESLVREGGDPDPDVSGGQVKERPLQRVDTRVGREAGDARVLQVRSGLNTSEHASRN